MQRGIVDYPPSRDLTPCDFLVLGTMKNTPPPPQEAEKIVSPTSDHRGTISEGAWIFFLSTFAMAPSLIEAN